MAENEFEDLGPNSGLAEEMYGQYVENPDSVSDEWREFFDHREDGAPAPTTQSAPSRPAPATEYRPQAPQAPVPEPAPAATDGDRPVPLRGATAPGAAENGDGPSAPPAAPPARPPPAKLPETTGQTLNTPPPRPGGARVSFPPLIPSPVLKARERVPAMNSSFEAVDGQPSV